MRFIPLVGSYESERLSPIPIRNFSPRPGLIPAPSPVISA